MKVGPVRTRLYEEVIGVGQNGLSSQLRHGLRQQGLDRGLGPDDDEGRGLDITVRGVDDASAPIGVVEVRGDVESEWHGRHCIDESPWARRARGDQGNHPAPLRYGPYC